MNHPFTHAVGFLAMEVRRRYARARAASDLGASAVEWVVITGILIAIAVAIGLIIMNFLRDEANSLNNPGVGGGGGGGGGGEGPP